MTNKQKQSADRMAVARAGIIGNRQWRSAVTNGAYPAGINGRTAAGRRYRDLVTEYSREIAGEGGPLNPAEMALIRQAAALTVRGEALQADIVSGRAADDEAIVRLANTLARILKQLERRHRQKAKTGRPPSTSVAASLSEHYATRKATGRIKS